MRKHPNGRVDQLEDRYLGMVEAPSSNLGTSTPLILINIDEVDRAPKPIHCSTPRFLPRRVHVFSSQREDGGSFLAHRWCGEVSGKTSHELANLRRGCGEVLVAVVDCEAGDFSFPGYDGANGLNARQRHHGFTLAFEQGNDFFFLRGVKLDVVYSAVHTLIPGHRA